LAALTVAVNVTVWPYIDGLSDELIAVVVGPVTAVRVTALLL
jgi:hypothetical protein